jgi:hypothetical protein
MDKSTTLLMIALSHSQMNELAKDSKNEYQNNDKDKI